MIMHGNQSPRRGTFFWEKPENFFSAALRRPKRASFESGWGYTPFGPSHNILNPVNFRSAQPAPPMVFLLAFSVDGGKLFTLGSKAETVFQRRGEMFKSAMLGCGGRAKGHAKAYEHVKKSKLVAVCDMNEERLHPFVEEFNIPQKYTDIHEMLDKECNTTSGESKPEWKFLLLRCPDFFYS
jgi:hypothetical protein